MIRVFPNTKEDSVLFVDTEFDDGELLQLGAVLYSRVEGDIFLLDGSTNFYIKQEKVGKYARKITGLTPKFLGEFGVTKDVARDTFEELLEKTKGEILFVSHGTKQDIKVLRQSGVYDWESTAWCTFNNAKRLLKREKGFSLGHLCNEVGFFVEDTHDAFEDAKNTIVVFQYLKTLED